MNNHKTNFDCGCTVEVESSSPFIDEAIDSVDIMECSLHKAAPQLLKELERMVSECNCFGTGIAYNSKPCLFCKDARTVIAAAKGDKL